MFPFFPLVHEYVPRHSLERFHFRGACGMIPPRAKGRSSSRFLVFLGALSIVYSQSTKKSILGIDIDIYIYRYRYRYRYKYRYLPTAGIFLYSERCFWSQQSTEPRFTQPMKSGQSQPRMPLWLYWWIINGWRIFPINLARNGMHMPSVIHWFRKLRKPLTHIYSA